MNAEFIEGKIKESNKELDVEAFYIGTSCTCVVYLGKAKLGEFSDKYGVGFVYKSFVKDESIIELRAGKNPFSNCVRPNTNTFINEVLKRIDLDLKAIKSIKEKLKNKDIFIAELMDVCIKYNLSLGISDGGYSLIIDDKTTENMNMLRDAEDTLDV